jgi:hypothetical protein
MKRLPIAALLLLGSFCWAEEASVPQASTPAATAANESMPKSGIEIMKAVICRELKDRQPVEELATAKVGETVIGWTQVRSGFGEVTITHRWLHGKEKVSDVPLAIKGSPYRTWSRKTLTEAGEWTLQVLNPEGEVLQEVRVNAE